MADFLKTIGSIAWVLGAWLVYSGLSMEVTVNPDGQGDVANLQLMHVQQLSSLLGALAIIEGTICLIGGGILDQMKAQADRLLGGDVSNESPEDRLVRLEREVLRRGSE